MHLHAWKEVLKEAYGHESFFLAAEERGELRGLLPLALVRSPLFGRSLVSMPFMDYGGVCGGSRPVAERPLVDEAVRLSARLRAKLVLRYLREPRLDMPRSLEKVTMWLELGTQEEALWKRLPSERRNRIRKAQKSGLVACYLGPEGLDDFYSVFAENMRDLGSPVHSRDFFGAVMRHLSDSTRLLVIRDGDRPVGAGLMLLHEGMISIPWVSSLRSAFSKCPNQLLYWEAMRFGIGEGFRTLDLGRSSRDSGTFEAKRQWGAEPVQLHWHYHPEDAAPPGEEVRRAAWAVGVWRHLPLAVVNRIGPWLRRGIAN
jgi:FemAB-related protein (PEP-CTERM system-associated)